MRYRKRSLFAHSDCRAENQPVSDTSDKNKTWRHFNFLEYTCYIHTELPQIKCGNYNTVKRVNYQTSS